jgi:hypothetical protein
LLITEKIIEMGTKKNQNSSDGIEKGRKRPLQFIFLVLALHKSSQKLSTDFYFFLTQ